MNEAAYNTLVDAVHHLMKLEKWEQASILNRMRIRMLLDPRLQFRLYIEAAKIMKNDHCLQEYAMRMYEIIKEDMTI